MQVSQCSETAITFYWKFSRERLSQLEHDPRLEVARPVLPLNGSYHKVSTEIADTKMGQVRQWHTNLWCQRNSP